MLEKLEFLIALAQERHFGRAAERCGVAQPTLSLGIQSLEQMLNVPLVKRSSRFQGFTPEGERVLVWARRLVGDAKAMRQEMRSFHGAVDTQLRIAAIPCSVQIAARLAVPFQSRNPGVRMRILGRPSGLLLDLLHQREIDAGITYISNEPIGDVSSIPLYRDRFVLLTTEEGPLGYLGQATWEQVANAPLCLFERDLQNRRIIDNVLRSLGAEPRPVMETDSVMALTSYVRLGRAASVLPSSVLDMVELNSGLRAIPIVEPDVSHTIGLIVSGRFPIQPALGALLEEARMLMPPEILPTA